MSFDTTQIAQALTDLATKELIAKLVAYVESAQTLGADVTATADELNVLAAVTPGTADVSKGLVLGTTRNIDTFRMTGKLFTPQATPETATDTATLTAAQHLTGVLVATPTAAAAYTTLTGALLEDAVVAIHPELTAGDCFDLTVINLGGTGDAITLTAAVSGITIVGDAVVLAAAQGTSQGTFRFRYTAADTFIVYRVA